MKIQTPNEALLAEALANFRPDEDPVIVAGGIDCDPCQAPFGGRHDDDGGYPSVGDRDAMPSAGIVHNLLKGLGVQPCRRWGAEPPQGTRDPSGCFTGRQVCGAVLPYRRVVDNATGTAYTLKAKKWFWPLIWVDASASTILINELDFQGDSVFENGEGSGALRPSAMFPSDGTNFVPGLPSIDHTSGLDFVLTEQAGATDQVFEGMFIGVSIRN